MLEISTVIVGLFISYALYLLLDIHENLKCKIYIEKKNKHE